MTEATPDNAANFDPAKLVAEGDRVADRLCEQVTTALKQHLRDELGVAPEINEGVSKELRDAMKLLRDHQDQVFGATLACIQRNFNPADEPSDMTATVSVSFAELSLQPLESLEENIAITRAANRAEHSYANTLWELRQRTAWWRDTPDPRLSDKSLSPQALCQAFFRGLGALDATSEARLMLFAQFDRRVLRKLEDLYEDLVKTLDAAGFGPLHKVVKRGDEQLQVAADPTPLGQNDAAEPSSSAQPPTSSPAGERPAIIDPQTWEMLGQLAQPPGPAPSASAPGGATGADGGGVGVGGFGGGTGGNRGDGFSGVGQSSGYSDQELAKDLSGLLRGDRPPGWTEAQSQDLISRAATVGQAFNRIGADPNLPAAIKPEFERMRFEVLKAALTDPQFFRDSAHPMRSMMDELARLAATSRLSGKEERERISRLLGGIQQQEGLEAGDVRDSLQSQEQIADEELENFLDEQLSAQSQRRQALIEKARKVVSEEFWLQTATRNCSQTLRDLLSSYWEPMMALRLLRHGVSSELWDAGVELLKSAISIADPQEGMPPDETLVETWLGEFEQQLRSVGMFEERVQRMRETLGVELLKFDQDSELGTESDSLGIELHNQSREELLTLALEIDSWFEVYDRENDMVRWLRAKGCNEDFSLAIFAQYSRHDQMQVPVDDLIHDLKRGMSAAVNPAPKARAALDMLINRSF